MSFSYKEALAGGGALLTALAFLAGNFSGEQVKPAEQIADSLPAAIAPAPECPAGTTELPEPQGRAILDGGDNPAVILCENADFNLQQFADDTWQSVHKRTGAVKTGETSADVLR